MSRDEANMLAAKIGCALADVVSNPSQAGAWKASIAGDMARIVERDALEANMARIAKLKAKK